MVLSTPSGPADGSDTEKWILGALRKCPHGVPPALSHSTPEGAATIAAGELSRTEGLLEAAAGLLAEAAQRVESERLLEEALRVLDDDPTAADELDRRSRELEDASRASAARGLAGTARAGLDPRWPPDKAARDLIAAIPNGGQVSVTTCPNGGGQAVVSYDTSQANGGSGIDVVIPFLPPISMDSTVTAQFMCEG